MVQQLWYKSTGSIEIGNYVFGTNIPEGTRVMISN